MIIYHRVGKSLAYITDDTRLDQMSFCHTATEQMLHQANPAQIGCSVADVVQRSTYTRT